MAFNGSSRSKSSTKTTTLNFFELFNFFSTVSSKFFFNKSISSTQFVAEKFSIKSLILFPIFEPAVSSVADIKRFFVIENIPPVILLNIFGSPSNFLSKISIIEIAKELPRLNCENCQVLNHIGKIFSPKLL